MHSTTQYRLIYLLMAITIFAVGGYLVPGALDTHRQVLVTAMVAAAFFVLVPALHVYLVIVKGKQKWWRLIAPFGLGILVARYTFPDTLTSYLDFMSWVRYPFLAIIIALECFILYQVISSLWKARKLKGDPRIHVLASQTHQNEKMQDMAIMMAHEPASWYFAVPRFSRQLPKAVANVNLYSASRWFSLVGLGALLLATAASYLLLNNVSHIAASVVSVLVGYSLISLVANYRISRYYSLYFTPTHLVINPTFFNLLVAEIASIQSVKAGSWPKDTLNDERVLGRGTANLCIEFSSPVTYTTFMGTARDEVSRVYVCVDNPQSVVASLSAAHQK